MISATQDTMNDKVKEGRQYSPSDCSIRRVVKIKSKVQYCLSKFSIDWVRYYPSEILCSSSNNKKNMNVKIEFEANFLWK